MTTISVKFSYDCASTGYMKTGKVYIWPIIHYIFGVHAVSRRIQMDPQKVYAIQDWAESQSILDIWRFMGFANFYRSFFFPPKCLEGHSLYNFHPPQTCKVSLAPGGPAGLWTSEDSFLVFPNAGPLWFWPILCPWGWYLWCRAVLSTKQGFSMRCIWGPILNENKSQPNIIMK